MNLFDKVTVKNGVVTDDYVLNKYSGEVTAIQAILDTIPSDKGIAKYSVNSDGQATFVWDAVGSNDLWVYSGGTGVKIGSVSNVNSYEGVYSLTSLDADYNLTKTLIVNKIGLYKVGNIVKLKMKVIGFMGSISYQYTYGEITVLNSTTKSITVSLIDSITNYTPPSAEWTFSLVAVDKAGLDFLLAKYKIKLETDTYVWTPTGTVSKNLDAGLGEFGSSNIISVKKDVYNESVTISVNASAFGMTENVIHTIINNTPLTMSGNASTPIVLNASGGTFYSGLSTINLCPKGYAISAVADYEFTIRLMRVGTVVYIF